LFLAPIPLALAQTLYIQTLLCKAKQAAAALAPTPPPESNDDIESSSSSESSSEDEEEDNREVAQERPTWATIVAGLEKSPARYVRHRLT
jgi:ribosomal protein L12E/L44/L45/RPP1/RPP2